MKSTRAVAILAAATLAMTLGACSQTGDEDGKVTLTIWDSGQLTDKNQKSDDGTLDESSSFLHWAATEFEKENPNVDVEVVVTAGDLTAEGQQFQAASIAGNGPDIRVGFSGGNTLSFAEFLLDLDGTFDQATMDDVIGWETAREDYQPDGRLLGLPYGGGTYFYVFYNKAMAKDLGIDLSTPPATWEDLLDIGDEVKAAGQNPFWVPNQEGYVGAWLISALGGGELGPLAFTDQYNGDAPIDSPEMVDAYAAYAELFSRGLTNPDAGSVAIDQLQQGFLQGKGLFMFSGGWENKGLVEAMGDDAGVFAIPMLAGAPYPGALAGGTSYTLAITNYSKHQEEAKDFLRFLAIPSVMDQYVKFYQSEPANSRSADISIITNPLLQIQAEMIATTPAIVFPFDNVMPLAVNDAFYRINATTFIGQTSPEDAAAQLQKAFDDDRG